MGVTALFFARLASLLFESRSRANGAAACLHYAGLKPSQLRCLFMATAQIDRRNRWINLGTLSKLDRRGASAVDSSDDFPVGQLSAPASDRL